MDCLDSSSINMEHSRMHIFTFLLRKAKDEVMLIFRLCSGLVSLALTPYTYANPTMRRCSQFMSLITQTNQDLRIRYKHNLKPLIQTENGMILVYAFSKF
jgi:hypothetical protein